MRSAFRLALLALVLAPAVRRASAAGRVSVAAAANLVYVLEPLNAEFGKANPDTTVTDETASSGSLVAQIANGAPYDVFLSADLDFPRRLIAKGGADGSSLVTFAYGRLVLWTTRPGPPLASVESAVRDPAIRRLAIANPKTAPYGQAAEQVLAALGLADEARPKLVFGENITQTAQFVSSGNADAGFVALSLVVSPKLKGQGRWLEVPSKLYAPIAQGAVLTRRGADNPAARRYLEFLRSPAARAIFERFGYGLP